MKPTLISKVLLLLLPLFFLTSCGEEGKKYVIGVSQCSDDGWRQQMNAEILRETFLYHNVDVDFRSADYSSEKQIKDIKYFIHKKVDLIVVAPNEAEPLTHIIEYAVQMGVPVVVVDRKINSDKYTAYVGADNTEIGRYAGNYISKLPDKNIRLLELTGMSKSTPAIERHEGFINAVKTDADISLIGTVDAGWQREIAYSRTDSLLKTGLDVDVIFAHNDMMAMGAYDAAKKYHKEDKIKFIGVDAIAGEGFGIEAVNDGRLTASFSYPTGGDKVMQVCMNILEGRDYKKENILRTSVVDKNNVENILLQSAQISELDTKIEKLNGKITTYISRYYTQKAVIFCVFVILILLAVLMIVMLSTIRSKSILNEKLSEQKEQLKTQYEQMVELSKQLEEATHAKLVFFTNISHDFRTPLTLIADPVEQLIASNTINADDKKLLSLVKKNTDILLRLVNQILDFRKYENGKMEFTPEPMDLKQHFTAWADSFVPALKKKHIHLSMELGDNPFITLADRLKLESIFFNLMSNAFKYTPENGKITVTLERITADGADKFRFSVANTGSLISPEHIEKIFDRFYKTDLHHSGSGIGLALAKAFVDMHSGTIAIESTEEKGTVFTVTIPVVKVEDETAVISQAGPSQAVTELIPDDSEEPELDSAKPAILVIDDNQDIRTYIHSLLGDKYTVIEAPDGLAGIRKAAKYVPDLIICDVMMPGIDGYECCNRLKTEMQTCHIPVILLTACSLVDQRIKGYAHGADSYISKPFSKELLLSRIDNLIANKKRLKEFFGDNSSLVKEDISNLDKDFVGKFKEIVEAEIDNSDLSVEDIGSKLGMSRIQLYRKMKSLTNYTPSELLRITRLKKARSMLVALDLTIAEVAYRTGFSSPSYFTKCYKDYFGENPGAIRKTEE